jgi:hypothetical protein
MTKRRYIDKKGLPTREGIYLVKGYVNVANPGSEPPQEVDVYMSREGELCCFQSEQGHVPVQLSGLEFISRVGDLIPGED